MFISWLAINMSVARKLSPYRAVVCVKLAADHYYEVEKMAGSETARHVAAAHASAVDWVAGVVREEGIECQLQLGEAVVAAVVAERGGVSGAAASTAGAEEGYGKWKKDKASRELREVG